MEPIEIDCPGCGQPLELDAGFAGGVCRCSSCGTMMTVPSDPRRQRAERLRRPDRPDLPRGVQTAPRPSSAEATASAAVAAPPPAAEPPAEAVIPPPERPERPERPAAAPRTPAPATTPAIAPAAAPVGAGVETYVTESGRTIEVHAAKVAVAHARRKRLAVRWATRVVLVGVVLAVVAVCVVLLIKLVRQPDDGIGRGGAAQTPVPPVAGQYAVGVDPAVNLLRGPPGTFLGLPLGRKTVFVLELSGAWSLGPHAAVGQTQRALGRCLRRLPPETQCQVLFFGGGAVTAIPAAPKAWTDVDHRRFDRHIWHTEGSAAPDAALGQALAARPDHIVLLLRQKLLREDLSLLPSRLAGKGAARLDVVMLGDDDPQVRTLTEAAGGKYLSIPLEVWARWSEEVEAAPATQP